MPENYMMKRIRKSTLNPKSKKIVILIYDNERNDQQKI